MKNTTWNNNRASVMVVAIIFAMMMAFSVASFLQLANFETRLSNVAFYSNSSLNLAEAGVERALYALNNEDWSGWNRSGNSAVMQKEEIDLGGNVRGIIEARVLSIDNNPTVQAGGTTEMPNRPKVVKQVEVKLSRRSLFANGITTRRGVTFKGGNALVNSYRSSRGKPSIFNVRDNGSVASVSVEADAISLSNSTIYGRVATGGAWPTVGPNGRIYGADTPWGVKVDPERVALDFAADFPMVSPPTSYHTYLGNINGSMTLGTPGATVPEVIKVDSISLSGQSELIIQGPVVIHLTGNGSISGKGKITILDGTSNNASAVFYVDGDLDIGGNGTYNATNDPANLLIYGTSTTSQQFNLHGNGQWQAAVYAPNANVDMKGGGSSGMMAGAIVADRVFMNGNYTFHYDEDLADRFASDTGYGMDRWREIYQASNRIVF